MMSVLLADAAILVASPGLRAGLQSGVKQGPGPLLSQQPAAASAAAVLPGADADVAGAGLFAAAVGQEQGPRREALHQTGLQQQALDHESSQTERHPCLLHCCHLQRGCHCYAALSTLRSREHLVSCSRRLEQ